MNQHLLVKIRQLGTPHRCVANLGKAHNTRVAHGASLSRAKAGPMSGAQPMSEANALAAANALAEAIALGLTCDWRLDLDRSGAPAFSLRS
jgi:hypothetical protein